MKNDKPSEQLPYATPAPPRVGSPEVPVPYFLFGLCMLPLMLGIVIFFEGNQALGALMGIPAAIGAVVLPIVRQMRER